MRTTLIATLAAATFAAGSALGATAVYDQREARFETKRAVVDAVKKVYPDAVVYERGETLPGDMAAELMPGETLPEDAPVREVRPELAEMIEDELPEGAAWVEVGPHLVAVTEERRILMTVYDAVE